MIDGTIKNTFNRTPEINLAEILLLVRKVS